MNVNLFKIVVSSGLLALLALPVSAADRHTLDTRVPTASHLPMLSRLPATSRLQLAIGLTSRICCISFTILPAPTFIIIWRRPNSRNNLGRPNRIINK
jgi:hypothetical protein